MLQEQVQKEAQKQRLAGFMAFPAAPQQGLRMPRFEGGLGLGGGRRRRYKGERRTYPVRDPVDLIGDLLQQPRRTRKGKKRRNIFDELP